ncbi:MAG: 30S ribosome-binding factor RbfA [Bauldia sp.]|nr:30S ribosome-binding factor RbfA [Bauldia sp.]
MKSPSHGSSRPASRAPQKQGAPQSQRQLRVGELIRHALAEILARGELHEPELDGVIVTVPEVSVSPDLQVATAFVMPLGGRDAERTAAALERNARFLRGAVAKRVELRRAPELRFRVDTSFAEGDKIDALLRTPEVRKDLEPKE